MPQLVVRSVQANDLNMILEIAGETGPGFNSLPNNSHAVADKIIHSIQSFAEKEDIQKRFYFFVMVDSETKKIVGTAGIDTCVGHPWPYYKFKVSKLSQTSKILNTAYEHTVLHLSSDYNDATELGALYIKPQYRGLGYGSFLSRSRCLFISLFTHLFSEKIVADMRGVSVDGISPFWEAVGRHFFGITYAEASYLKATQGSQILVDLLPHYPLYTDFFSMDAKRSIGKTHELAIPALQVLTAEGFIFRDAIDVFDAGPTIEADQSALKTVQYLRCAVLKSVKKNANFVNRALIANTKLDFRATLASFDLTSNGEIMLDQDVLALLNINIGDEIAYCPF